MLVEECGQITHTASVNPSITVHPTTKGGGGGGYSFRAYPHGSLGTLNNDHRASPRGAGGGGYSCSKMITVHPTTKGGGGGATPVQTIRTAASVIMNSVTLLAE
jgi:hypothetical protein